MRFRQTRKRTIGGTITSVLPSISLIPNNNVAYTRKARNIEVINEPVSHLVAHSPPSPCYNGNISSDNVTNEMVECISTNGKTIDQLQPSDNPYFILKYGPTGSGKGSKRVQDEIANLGITKDNTITFEVDRIIESIKSFRSGSLKQKNKYRTAKSQENLDKVYKELTSLYFAVRKKSKANNHQDTVMGKAIERKINIVLETTGMSSIDWITDRLAGTSYKIVVIYPVAPVEKIKERATTRAMSMKGVFRLPDPKFINMGVTKARGNIVIDLFKLMEEGKIDKVILINNN